MRSGRAIWVAKDALPEPAIVAGKTVWVWQEVKGVPKP